MSFNDIEFVALLGLMALLFMLGLKRRENLIEKRYFGIDLPMSAALKGIACVLILMGHYVNRRRVAGVDITLFSSLIYQTTANIALAIFMFFSGYGLSVKKDGGGGISVWFNRMKKVYLPLLLTCIVTLIIYSLLPNKYSLEESETLTISKDIWYIHHFDTCYLSSLIPHLFGWKDWYVFCIMIFYSFFYLSQFVTRNKPQNQTLVLWLMFIAYFACAFIYYGPSEAHWYRYCWAFFLGHIFAKMVKNGKVNRWDALMLFAILSSIVIESRFMIISYIIAIVTIVICSLLNKRYIMKSKELAFMGSISYFFYLSHTRIGYPIIAYINKYSVILWVVITMIISFCLFKMYNVLLQKKSGF